MLAILVISSKPYCLRRYIEAGWDLVGDFFGNFLRMYLGTKTGWGTNKKKAPGGALGLVI